MTTAKVPVPEQRTGAKSDAQSERSFATEEEAQRFFEIVKRRLLQVRRWHEWGGTAGFKLTDDAGSDVDRAPRVGDHVRIDIPGPGPSAGDGYDWVRVEAVEESNEKDVEYLAIRVRPAPSPLNAARDVAHFFSEEATSNFVVKRDKTAVSAEVHGRNEKPNASTAAITDKIRNTAVAAGAVSGFSKIQWSSLAKGLVADEA